MEILVLVCVQGIHKFFASCTFQGHQYAVSLESTFCTHRKILTTLESAPSGFWFFVIAPKLLQLIPLLFSFSLPVQKFQCHSGVSPGKHVLTYHLEVNQSQWTVIEFYDRLPSTLICWFWSPGQEHDFKLWLASSSSLLAYNVVSSVNRSLFIFLPAMEIPPSHTFNEFHIMYSP